MPALNAGVIKVGPILGDVLLSPDPILDNFNRSRIYTDLYLVNIDPEGRRVESEKVLVHLLSAPSTFGLSGLVPWYLIILAEVTPSWRNGVIGTASMLACGHL